MVRLIKCPDPALSLVSQSPTKPPLPIRFHPALNRPLHSLHVWPLESFCTAVLAWILVPFIGCSCDPFWGAISGNNWMKVVFLGSLRRGGYEFWPKLSEICISTAPYHPESVLYDAPTPNYLDLFPPPNSE